MARLLEILKNVWRRSMFHRALLVAPPVALFLWVGLITVGVRESAQYFTAKVEQGDISQVVQATGTINPVNTVPVGAVVSGNVVSVSVDFNSQVKKRRYSRPDRSGSIPNITVPGPGGLSECHRQRGQPRGADRHGPRERGEHEGQCGESPGHAQ